MKKVLLICFLCVFCAVCVNGQHESSAKKFKASAGFMLNPQAEISLENIEAGFTSSVPLFILISLEKNNWAITPIYNVTANSYGGFIKRVLPKDLGLYVVILKKVHDSELYSGLGFDFPVAKGIASGFIEPGIKLKEGEAEERIRKIIDTNKDIYSVSILNNEGVVVLSTDKILPTGTDMSQEESFVFGVKDFYVKDIYFSPTLKDIIYAISAPLKEEKSGKVFGVLVVRFKVNEIYANLQDRVGLGETGESFLIDRKFYFISPSYFLGDNAILKERDDTQNSKECFSQREVKETVKNGYLNFGIDHVEDYVDYRKVKILGTHAYIPEAKWCLSVEMDRSEILAPLNRVLALDLIALGLLLAVLFFISYFLNEKVVGPIRSLLSGAKSISENNFSLKLNISERNEIGDLAKEFNEMAEKLKNSREEIEEKVKAQTKEIFEKSTEIEEKQKATLNILEDIEEEKKKYEKLSSDLEKFKLAVDNVSDQVVITDPNGVILYGNKGIERITGYTLEESLGKKAGILWSFPMPKEYYEKMWDTIKNKKEIFSGEIRNKRKNGEIYDAAVSISPILNKNGEILFFVGIERDITQEKNIDRTKTEFVSLASHQLRTPLSTINWYTEMLLDEDAGKINEEQKKYLNEIYTGNQRMVELVNSLLNVSRLEMGKIIIEPKEVDVMEMANSVVNEVRPMFSSKKQSFEKDFEKDFPKINLDPRLFRMVFQNLLSNSIKYTQENGKIMLKITKVKSGEEIAGKKIVADSMLVTVSDNGYGIRKDQQDKIFTKLFRADNVKERDTEGTGLGLYIIKTVIENSGGSVWFVSEENKGTTFYVIIPLTGMIRNEGITDID